MEQTNRIHFTFSLQDLICALKRALLDNYRNYATYSVVCGLASQILLETGAGFKSCWNYNLGNIRHFGKKGNEYYDSYFTLDAGEFIDGKWVTLKSSKFRAYTSLRAGANDYIKLIANRFGGFDSLVANDIAWFAKQLHDHKYYTAPEHLYSAALLRCNTSIVRSISQDDFDLIVFDS